MAVRGLRMSCAVLAYRDAPSATALTEGLPAEVVIADTAYNADRLRQAIAAKVALAIILNNPSGRSKIRSTSISIPSAISFKLLLKAQAFRRVSTRLKKPPKICRAVATLAVII